MENLDQEIANLSPAKRALLDLRLKNKERDISVSPAIIRRAERESAVLSFAQQRLWFLDQLEPDKAFYNMPRAIRMGGALNVEALDRTLATIIWRHESLRTTFGSLDGSPVQIINKGAEVQLPVIDLSELPAEERDAEARRLVSEEAERPFDLAKGPLMRASLLRLAEDDHVLLLTMHHIVSDGWSAGILMRELTALYEAFSAGKPSPLAELPIQYADFSVWQREWLQGEVLEEQLAYWSEKLGGELPRLELPTDKPRPVVQTYRGSDASTKISKDISEQLKAMAQREGVTLYMLLLAAFQVLLSRYSGQEDIIVGSPIAGRNRAETEGLIGFFVNTLVVRTDLTGNPTFRDLLKRVREVALGAYAHQDLPFEKLVEELQPARDLSQNPLFQVMFALQNAPGSGLELGDLKLSSFSFENKTARFELEVHLWERGNGSITCSFVYNTDLFAESTVVGMARHYQTLLESIVADPGREIQELRLLTAAEEEELIVGWNDTGTDYPRAKSIGELFEAQVDQSPDAVAVVYEDRQLTYRELNERANQVARHLQKLGVGPEVMVAISVERSLEMVVGLLGILKSGGAYVPFDPTYPPERLGFMAEDAQVSVLLTQERFIDRASRDVTDVVSLDSGWPQIGQESEQNPENTVTAENAAYVIYTSGSTGKPKGVLGVHRASLNRFSWMWQCFPFEANDVCCQKTSLNFVDSIWEIFGPLLKGTKLVIIKDDDLKDPYRFVQSLADSKVTRIVLVPSLLRLVLDAFPDLHQRLPHLRLWVVSGEALPVELSQRFRTSMPESVLINLYGSSEVAADVTCYATSEGDLLPCVPIGRPIANTQAYVLDAHLHPVPVGVAGQLYIGGDSLARGYLRRPDLTVERFIADPFSNQRGARLYMTGDTARYLPGGEIAYLGRSDYQVKIRGQRVELGEIESALSTHEAVSQSLVISREDTVDNRLVAYVATGKKAAPTVSDLRTHLKNTLPEYMIPASFVFLYKLPLTPNGKVDRRRLPAPDRSRLESEESFVAPRDELELQLTRLWEELLCVKPVGLTDNFFELGGHSLLAVRLFAQIEKRFNKNLPLATLFQAPTIEHLASILRQKGWVSSWSSLVPIKPSGSKPALYFIHGGGGNVLCYRSLARLLGPDQPVYALQAQGLDGKRPPHASLEEMAAHYLKEIRALQPDGPYYLGGSSGGGALAFEMAQQLHAQDQEVGLLVMIDTFFPGYPRYMPNRTLFRSKLHRTVVRADAHLGELIMRRPKERLKYILDGLGRIKKNVKKNIVNRLGLEDPLRRTIQRVREANVHAYKIYKPKAYSGRIIYFWCAEMTCRPYMDNRLGWDAVAEGGLEVHMVPGSHTGLLDIEPNTRVLVEELNKCLQKIQAALPDERTESTNEGAHRQADQLGPANEIPGVKKIRRDLESEGFVSVGDNCASMPCLIF